VTLDVDTRNCRHVYLLFVLLWRVSGSRVRNADLDGRGEENVNC